MFFLNLNDFVLEFFVQFLNSFFLLLADLYIDSAFTVRNDRGMQHTGSIENEPLRCRARIKLCLSINAAGNAAREGDVLHDQFAGCWNKTEKLLPPRIRRYAQEMAPQLYPSRWEPFATLGA